MSATMISALVGIVAPLCGFGVLAVTLMRERTTRAREREQKMQSELASMTTAVGDLADAFEKDTWKDEQAHRDIQRSLDEIRRSLERLLDGRR